LADISNIFPFKGVFKKQKFQIGFILKI